MAENVFPTFPPTYRQFRRNGEPMQARNSVRVYRSSPDYVQLQIRAEFKYLSVSLPLDQARHIATTLLQEAGP